MTDRLVGPRKVKHRSGSTTDDVTDRLREAILDGTIPPASWLREADLAETLRVSRTPIREALKRLADEQLVEREANRGCRVRPMTFDDTLAVYSVRESLDALAARTVALAQPEGLVDSLRQLQRQAQDPAHSLDELALINLNFHRTIRSAASNAYLERFLVQVEHAVRRFGQGDPEGPDRMAEVYEEHEEIIAAIEAGDANAAGQAAARHVRLARNARVASIMRHI